ncbi:MAG: hypothetical protein ACRDOA_20085 [Streptosporangiaceae bacterium]
MLNRNNSAGTRWATRSWPASGRNRVELAEPASADADATVPAPSANGSAPVPATPAPS